MPPGSEILQGLSTITNRATVIAIAWHVVVAIAVIALAGGWRPSLRTARFLIATPLASVAGIALAFDNLFNGLVFAATTLALTAMAAGAARDRVSQGSTSMRAIGGAMIVFGWVYPHFLERDATAYLYASPLGLIPCPTIAVAIGFTLVGNGLEGRAWSLMLTAVGLFYGLFGVLRLGVWIDIGLLAGVVSLAASALHTVTTGRPAPVRPGPTTA